MKVVDATNEMLEDIGAWIDWAQEYIEELEMLEHWTEHERFCDQHGHLDRPCDCGLTKLRKELSKLRKRKP